MLANAVVIPTQADRAREPLRVRGGRGKQGAARPIKVDYLEEAFAAVTGVAAGERVVAEGGQNLRPGSVVAEADRQPVDTAKAGKGAKGKKGGG